MKTPTLLTVVLGCVAALLLLTACHDDSAKKPAPKPPPSATVNPVSSDPFIRADLEKRLEVERTLREKTQQRLNDQESSRSWWQGFSLLTAAAAIVLLLVGAGLGSQARKESEAHEAEP